MIELWEILVPTTRRVGGKPYRTRYHRVWDAKVRALAVMAHKVSDEVIIRHRPQPTAGDTPGG